MEIPRQNYTLESFLDYIIKNTEKVFHEKQERKWLKVYLVYTIKDWEKLFEGLKKEKYGEITHIIFDTNPIGNPLGVTTEYYVYQWIPGLILLFTSSTQEYYERTIKHFIASKRGITQSWIRPFLMDQIRKYLIESHHALTYRFIGRRFRYWKYPTKIRSDYDRRISYSGEDADYALNELAELYGIIPSSIDMRIGESKFQINRNGLFVIRHINRTTIGVLQEIIEKILAEQIRIRNISEEFIIKTKSLGEGRNELKVQSVVAGKIILPNRIQSKLTIDNMFHKHNDLNYDPGYANIDDEDRMETNFSFLDTFIQEHPLIFAATVLDETKGTVFGISGEENGIALIPKHRTTFESFLNFFNYIAENFDHDAGLAIFR
ncbi:MAG: hypothetical protein GEU26_13800 [Nitrososphaeraceae archaeon]|nr:hypothetical protein [Nitrososphaeraceae archaeon]